MYGADLTEEGAPTIRGIAIDEANKVQSNLTTHINNKSNPHGVTKTQVGLSNVDNTADVNKPVSTAQATAIADAKKAGTDAQAAVVTHNTAVNAHNDIRILTSDLSNKLNAFLDVDDETLDQVSEIIKLVNDNVTTLEGLLATKVNINDIADNLATNVPNRPLSAAQGVVIKSTTDGIQTALTTHTTNKNNPHEVTAA
jgi:hypothetical protein